MKRFYPLISVVLFFLIIGSIYYFWQPKYQEYKQMQEKLSQTEQSINRAEEILKELKQTKTDLKQYDFLINKTKIALPTESLVLDLNVFLRQVSRNYGLLLNNINISEENDQVDISLSLSGTYEEFISFLKFLHKNYKIFKIGDVSFASQEEMDSFEVNLTTYYLPETISDSKKEVASEEIY